MKQKYDTRAVIDILPKGTKKRIKKLKGSRKISPYIVEATLEKLEKDEK